MNKAIDEVHTKIIAAFPTAVNGKASEEGS